MSETDFLCTFDCTRSHFGNYMSALNHDFIFIERVSPTEFFYKLQCSVKYHLLILYFYMLLVLLEVMVITRKRGQGLISLVGLLGCMPTMLLLPSRIHLKVNYTGNNSYVCACARIVVGTRTFTQ